MNRGDAERIQDLLGKGVYVSPISEEDESQRYISLVFESNPVLATPAGLLNKLGRAGLMDANESIGALAQESGDPALKLIGQSSIYTGPGGLRYCLTLEDLNFDIET
jgi:hypothetical protein